MALLERRRELLGPNLSIAYSSSRSGPLTIVRGSGTQLFDAEGRAYLDCVNNVCHVGHCHPKVVAAAQKQLAELNTNTRYLYPSVVAYAERLRKTLPPELDTFYFVCSGSEATDLALRLARSFTKQRDVVCVDHGYHGHTGAVIEVSPYKFNGPGGEGRPEHTQVAEAPDLYRGRIRSSDWGDEAIGAQYAESVRECVGRVRAAGRGVAGFICESVQGCAGQVPLPAGYLRHAYAHVRAAGGVCIADEVQTGFGRVGSHFWAFQTQGVVPDIVTMGKPIGNGFPMAAVAVRRDIARAFSNGMEYFNTFGGNPVSMAVGLAVLDVIEEERLQESARVVGEHWMRRLRELADKHALIGDVRGLGLFIGVELVRSRETREPAGDEASWVVNELRERGVLISTDGPHHNVLKLKPPLTFSRADADKMVRVLDVVLSAQPRARL